MKQKFILLAILAIAAFASCKKDSTKGNQGTTGVPGTSKLAPDGFNFATTKQINVSIALRTNNNQPLKGVLVSIYLPGSTAPGSAIFHGLTNSGGDLNAVVTVPSYVSKLVIDPAFAGLLRNATAMINGNSLGVVIGGPTGYSGDIVADSINNNPSLTTTSSRLRIDGVSTTDIGYPAGYTVANAFAAPANLGVPAYLEPTIDPVDATMLSFVNSSLPESISVVKTHPQYLQNTVNNVVIVEKSDVWITFVSEGAGYQNVLGYFTFKTGSPPTSATGGTAKGGIDKITYIYPNASAKGSGGGLIAGDKVKLGTFDAGTTIAFVLLQNAWTGSGVNANATKFYSLNNLNPEKDPTLKQHAIILYDDIHQVYLLGFDDQDRQTGGSDNDFNDVVFYASSNPVTAISQTGIPPVDPGKDSDGDGVPDQTDAFPNDPTRAFISYYPSQTTFANIAFEDNWPSKGDYDMNDLVLQYRYTFISNAQNQIVSMTGTYNVLASGASFKNGFGVQLPVDPAAVASVTGCKYSSGTYVKTDASGLESGQSKAVFIPFDNSDLLAHNYDFSYFVNTLTSKSKVVSDTATVNISFATPVDGSVLTPSAINPFLISNQRRGYEIHMAGYAPTDLVDKTLFGALDDNSVPSAGQYYISKENMPWAISFGQTFIYPLETVPITKAYLHFADWALYGGTSYPDWYSNTTTSYRDNTLLYTK